MRTLIIGTTVACGLFSSPAFTQQPSRGQASAQYGTIETKPPAGHGPTASEWSALANLPDWTGVWTPEWDIVQGVCLEGNFVDQVDTNGYAIFVPIKPDAK